MRSQQYALRIFATRPESRPPPATSRSNQAGRFRQPAHIICTMSGIWNAVSKYLSFGGRVRAASLERLGSCVEAHASASWAKIWPVGRARRSRDSRQVTSTTSTRTPQVCYSALPCAERAEAQAAALGGLSSTGTCRIWPTTLPESTVCPVRPLPSLQAQSSLLCARMSAPLSPRSRQSNGPPGSPTPGPIRPASPSSRQMPTANPPC